MNPREGKARERLRAAAVELADALVDLLTRAEPGRGAQPAAAVFTVRTLAAHLHRSPSTVRAWCERGEIDASRAKGRWFIRNEAVERRPGSQRLEPAPGRPITTRGEETQATATAAAFDPRSGTIVVGGVVIG